MEIMKNKRKILAFAALIVLIMSWACTKGDGEADFGDDIYVYMPQATVGGGINNYYPVPGGAGEYTYNFIADANKLNIILGVTRSGKITDAGGFSVNVLVSQAETDKVVDADDIDVEALPQTLYEIPNTVSVDAGKNSATFYLTVDAKKLLDGSYDGKKLALAVTIDNPTQYKLSEGNKVVVVIVDVDEIRPFFEGI